MFITKSNAVLILVAKLGKFNHGTVENVLYLGDIVDSVVPMLDGGVGAGHTVRAAGPTGRIPLHHRCCQIDKLYQEAVVCS